jgi:lipoprotein-anchoring transpeptidase ErfK/SrfK
MEIEPIKGPEAHIGIHGTAESARIGRNQSSGCIRLANWDIVRLAKMVGKGTRISWQAAPAPIKAPALMANNAQ